jgi:DNA-binding transcriptional regulator YiaG
MSTTTTVDRGYTPNQYFSYIPMPEIRRDQSSSPSLCLEKILFQKKEEATQAAHSKQLYVIVVVEGRPLVIAKNTVPQIEKPLDNTDTQLTERLDLIKSRLALSITQLAELFGVTRKAIYDWYDGAEPRRATTSRMELLIEILDAVPERIDIRRLKAVWNIPVSGKSFLAVFGDDKLDSISLRAVLKEKLHELSPRLVATTNSIQKRTSQLGEAHLAEIDRRIDFG